MRALVEFDLATGLRKGNLRSLQWKHVDMKRRHAVIEGIEMKNGQPLGIPLNDAAMAVLARLRGKHATHVFSNRGEPLRTISKDVFDNMLKRAGIKNFRFHDLRHTWASWHVQAGTPLHELQALGGWQSIQMVQRYAHLSSTQLAKAASNIDARLPRARMKLIVNK